MSEQELPRVLTLKDATMRVVSSVIGVGIFFTPGGVAKNLPSAGWFFAAWVVLPWDAAAADLFVSFRGQGIRLGSMDLKIACIALVHDATLLTRNTSDFAQIPGLRVAN